MSIMDSLDKADPQVCAAIQQELNRQRTKLELIASENIVSRAVMEAQGSVLTNKYAEGYPGKRYYGGCECVDVVETLAIERAKELFGAGYVNVQPHSGAQANMAVFFSLLSPGDTYMGMNLTDGGHLTHGSAVNMSGKYFHVIPYGVDKETECIDYNALEKQAKEVKPKLIVAGASAYARIIDFERLSAIAKAVEIAKKNFFHVPMIRRTIPHLVQGEDSAGVVLLRPASPGTGVIAGGPVRAVLDCAGVHDVLSKSLGSANAINIVHATVDALSKLEQPEAVAARRGLPLEDVAPQSMLRARAEGEADKRAQAEKQEAEKAAEGVGA